METNNLRPNIRIEIHNNFTEDLPMEVDPEKSENEEGEISDEPDVPQDKTAVKDIWASENVKGIFSTGINIFDKQEQEKLQERAKRFALKPEEINIFTDEDLRELHNSLGITAENRKLTRFEAVHMIGIKGMCTEDLLEYYAKYAPVEVEWMSDDSCNVIWSDDISAARAMHYTSKVVRGMPAREPCDPYAKEFLDDIEETERRPGQSILIKNELRVVELKEDDEMICKRKPSGLNTVDISEIKISIPPGYWRLGQSSPKTKCILVRFSLLTDRKPFTTELFSKYYRKLGTTIFDGEKGVISEKRKNEIRSIFERNRALTKEKNPWGSLARNWDHDLQFREREPVTFDSESVEPPIEIKNSKILSRLGEKRKLDDELENLEAEDSDEKEEETEKKILKMPRMRMYADEEEEKVKRRKILQKIKVHSEKITKDEKTSDLRNILGTTNKRPNEDTFRHEPEVADLGSKLKNRNKKMVFAVDSDLTDLEYDNKQNLNYDVRSLLSERRRSDRTLSKRLESPIHRRQISPPSRTSPEERRERHFVHRRLEGQRKSPSRSRGHLERTLHSDNLYSDSDRHGRRRHNYDDEERDHKPKSKVAVVIKTQKTPTVASTIWSRVNKPNQREKTSSESESDYDDSEKNSSGDTSSSESKSEMDSEDDTSVSIKKESNNSERPGFSRIKSRLGDHRSPLKITMTNDRFRK